MTSRLAALLSVLALIAAVLGAAIGLGIAAAWIRADSDSWTAITALGTGVIAAASLVGLGALLLAAQQGIALRRQARIQFGPYLRVDLGPESTAGTWRPPEVDEGYQFDWGAFNPGREEPSSPLGAWQRQDGIDLCIWVANQQVGPGGTAHNIEIVAVLACPPAPGTGESEPEPFSFVLRVHYLEPGRRIRYRIATVDPEIPYLSGEIIELEYFDLYGNRLAFAHGAAAFEWAGQRRTNSRSTFRGEQ